MNSNICCVALAIAFALPFFVPVSAQVMVDGAPMCISKSIFDHAINSIASGKGVAMLRTVKGESPTATVIANTPTIIDSKSGMAHVTTAGVIQSNGLIHVVDRVLLPK